MSRWIRSPKPSKSTRKAVQLGTARFETWQNLSPCYRTTGNSTAFIYYTEQGMEYFPNQALLYYFNGYGHLRKNITVNPLPGWSRPETGIERSCFTHRNQCTVGRCIQWCKRLCQVGPAFDEALFNPNNDYVLNNYSYYLTRRAKNILQGQSDGGTDHEKTIRIIQVIWIPTPGAVLWKANTKKPARSWSAPLPNPTLLPHIGEHYGDILFQLGEVDEAVKQGESPEYDEPA